ncbi:MAG: hypothetical protein KDA32_10700 [Phycisphaerales bacterium]|nr:hypothetical protein [Phycisphaerales bacterium]
MSDTNQTNPGPQRAGLREKLALDRVVTYLWSDERTDYEALPPQGRKGHVFEDLQCLRNWLHRVNELEQSGFHIVVVREEGSSV